MPVDVAIFASFRTQTITRNLTALNYAICIAEGGIYEGSTKNDKGRVLRIAPETVAVLREHRAAQEKQREAVGDRWVETGFVFTKEHGEHLRPRHAGSRPAERGHTCRRVLQKGLNSSGKLN